MTGFLISAMIVVVLVVFIWSCSRVIDGDRVATIAVCLFLILGLIINSATKREAEGPCHEYKTRLMYNAAAKTMMPSRVCVLRGEWVDDGKEISHD